MQKKPATKATQKYLDISEIREGVVVLKDGSLRAVLLVSSINFELKSEIERNSIIYAYQAFLNSLEFPIQIVISSRRLEIDDYLRRLEERKAVETSELIKLQITDYIEFIKRLITIANIMEKRFYVVVPYYPAPVKPTGFLEKLFPSPSQKQTTSFEENKRKLLERAEMVASGLRSIGLRAVQLNTQELIELFYNFYNPETATKQKLPSISQISTEIIEKLPEEMEI